MKSKVTFVLLLVLLSGCVGVSPLSSRSTELAYQVKDRKMAFESINNDTMQGVLLKYDMTLEEYEIVISGDYVKPSGIALWTGNLLDLYQIDQRNGDIESRKRTGRIINEPYLLKNVEAVIVPGISLDRSRDRITGKTITATSDSEGRVLFNDNIQRELKIILDDYFMNISGSDNLNSRIRELKDYSEIRISNPKTESRIDLTAFNFVNERIVSYQQRAEEQRKIAEEKRVQDLAERQRQQEAERLVRIAENKQILQKIKTNGSYVNTQAHFYAFRFIEANDMIGCSIVFHSIYPDGRETYGTYLAESGISSDLKITVTSRSGRFRSESFTVLDNGNLRSVDGIIWVFTPFIDAKGKVYSLVAGRNNSRLSFGFSDSYFVTQEYNSRIINDPSNTYAQLSDGLIRLKFSNGLSRDLIKVGPFIVSSDWEEVWLQNR